MMKKTILFLLMFGMALNINAQVGSAHRALSLEDNHSFGIVWEPKGLVTYRENEGVGVYGLIITINKIDDYLDCRNGHKVSIEFQDSTKEIYTIVSASKNFYFFDKTSVYEIRLLIYPNYDKLTSTKIKRIVIQRDNGKIWTIETKPKRATKLLKEFADAKDEALASYKMKVSNDDYFQNKATDWTTEINMETHKDYLLREDGLSLAKV